MLRITAQSDPAAACRYFEHATHDYYLEGEELAGQWGGKGARLLGLSGEVKESDFKSLAYNRFPGSDKRLTGRDHANRRVGYDFTFSVPKSVTLAYELNKDERIMTAFREAVDATMADIEADALVRDRRGGKEDVVKPGNLVHATFVHRSSRPVNGVPDCQLHAHCFVFSAAKYDGRWSALELGQVKADAPYYEALFMARLGKSLVDMGIGIRRKGRFFELDGVSDSLVDKFSNRKKLIDKVATERGITNPDFKAELGGKTREHKSENRLTPARLREEWLSRLTNNEREKLNHLPGQENPLPTPEKSARFAIEHSFYNEAVRPVKRVLEEGLRHGVGRITLDELKREMDTQGLVTKGERATTLAALEMESGLLDFARDGRGTRKAINPKAEAPDWMTRDQKNGIRHLLRSKDAITLARGAAGVGKTEALKVVADGAREAGYAVQAIAQSNEAAKELKKVDAGYMTIESFLRSEKAQRAVRGGVVILDEASLVGTTEMSRVFDVLKNTGARGILVGDTRQHAAVAAGAPFRLLQERGIKAAEITEIVRQKDARYKAAAYQFSEHDILGGLASLKEMGCIHEIPDEYRTESLVMDYMAETKAKREVLVVCPTHAEAEPITAGIRAALHLNGTLKGEDKTFEKLVKVGWSEAELNEAKNNPASPQAKQAEEENLLVSRYGAYERETIQIAEGDKLRATAGFTDLNGQRITNRMRFTVTGFSKEAIKADSETGIKLLIPNDAGHLAHAYVSTSFSGQGRTADVVLVAESTQSYPAADRSQMYVSASRGRYSIRVYTDDFEALREAADRDRVKMNASDLVVPENRVKAVALMQERVKQIARKVKGMAKQKVRELTKRKERDYGIEVC